MESGYPEARVDKSMEDIADVAVLNNGPNSSNKCNENNTGYVVSKATSCSDSFIDKIKR